MKSESKFKKPLYTGAVAIGLALGTMGVASAATQPAPAPTDTAVEADTAVDSNVQDPSYTGSVQAPAEDVTLSEADEATQLEGLATITPEEAATAANAAVAGEVSTIELDNENGTVVYSVGILDTTGAQIDVTVDAGDGTVLDQQADDESEDESISEADESDNKSVSATDDDAVQHENEHEGANDPDEGHED